MTEADAINALAKAVTDAANSLGAAIVIAAFIRGFLSK